MKKLGLIILVLCFSSTMFSQNLIVKSFEKNESDLSARVTERLDNNDTPCALIKVQSVLSNLIFEGNIIGDVENKTSEYWVYLTEGTKRLTIRHKDNYPLTILFSDYGEKSLERSSTYTLVLTTSITGMSNKSLVKGYKLYKSRNYSEALPHVLDAVNKDNEKAQLLLGCFYFNGEGVNKDLSTAYMYFKKSADKGNARAQFNVAQCLLHGQGTTSNPSAAVQYYEKIKDEFSSATSILGNCYALGIGVGQDYDEAKKLFKKASEAQDKDGSYGLAYCYFNGFGVKQNNKKAYEYYQKAASLGSSSAIAMLGYLYYTGKGGKKDDNQAFLCFKRAAEMGLPSAQAMLGICYYNGVGVDVNVDMAKDWLNKAKDAGNRNALEVLERINDNE